MTRVRRAAALAALASVFTVFLAGGTRPLRAGDPPPPTFDDELGAAHALVRAEKWADGEAALRRLFVSRRDETRVRGRLREIEDDLQICMFRQAVAAPDAAAFFGPALKKFVPSTRAVELEYPSTSGAEWRVDESLTYFGVRFEGEAAIEFTPVVASISDAAQVGVLINFDASRASGHLVVPYVRSSDPWTGEQGGIERSVAVYVSPSGYEFVAEKPFKEPAKWTGRVAVTRTGRALSLRRGSQIAFAVGHGRTGAGIVGVIGAPIRDVKLRGRLEAASLQRAMADRLADEFRRWKETSWDRTREIPAWARIAPREDSDDLLGLLPADGRFLEPEQVEEVVRRILRNDPDGAGWARGIAELSEPRTAAYFRGLVAYGRREFANAVAHLDAVLAEESGFLPARLFRGLSLAEIDRDADARAELRAVIAARPAALRAYLGLAWMALDDYDFEGAVAVLREATAHGGYGPELDEISIWAHRAAAGPGWTRRFRVETAHFAIESDLSAAACSDVGEMLERAQPEYVAAVGQAPRPAARARVYLFASEDGFHGFTRELGIDSASLAGAYHPGLRTLFLFMPENPSDLKATVRHEGFHQYLARSIRHAPDWMNEGWAQAIQGDRGDEIPSYVVEMLFRPHLVPVRRLVAMDHAEFMQNAHVHYFQARRLVMLLLKTRDPQLTGILRRYLDALRAGASQEEANARVLEPVMDSLERAFAKSLR